MATFTYNERGQDFRGGRPLAGYSEKIVVDEAYTLKVSDKLDPAATAPLLCAGITTYSPAAALEGCAKDRRWVSSAWVDWGHMGVKFARAFGAHIVLFTTSPERPGMPSGWEPDEVVVSRIQEEMKKHLNSFDFILDCVSANHDINAYLSLVKLDGTLVLVGAPEHPIPIAAFNLIMPRKQFAGSGIGGIAETQEMLDFCAEHGITFGYRDDQDRSGE